MQRARGQRGEQNQEDPREITKLHGLKENEMTSLPLTSVIKHQS